MKKILVITNIPNPYRIPLFAELSRQLKVEGMDLKVIFAAMGYKRRQYKIDLEKCGFEFDSTDVVQKNNIGNAVSINLKKTG